MAITVKAGGNFQPAPAGTHAGVCVDVIDHGMMEVTYQGRTRQQHKITIAWQLDVDLPDGKPFLVRRRYTASLHEKSALRKDLESWRGRAFTNVELDGFNLEDLLNVGCFLNIVHRESGNGTFANVASIMRLPKNMTAPQARDYIRVQDRPQAQTSQTTEDGLDGLGVTDDDIPF
jgi:hypothetical protein